MQCIFVGRNLLKCLSTYVAGLGFAPCTQFIEYSTDYTPHSDTHVTTLVLLLNSVLLLNLGLVLDSITHLTQYILLTHL